MSDEQLDKLAAAAADELISRYSVGVFSRFCDEDADFDYVDEEELAAVLRPFLKRAQAGGE